MIEALTLALAAAGGCLLGAVFYGGLWWTIREGLASKCPALWFFASLMVRMAITLPGLYFVSGGHWDRLALCLLGFLAARVAVTRMTKSWAKAGPRPLREAGHAA